MHNDKLEILELLNRYILSIDTHDAVQFADNFHDDAVYVSPFGTATGREQILATINQWHAGGITAGKRHMMGPWRIDVDGNTATSTSSYWVVNTQDGTSIVATGAYTDVITKKNGIWKLQKRVQTIDPSFKM
jgi:ketosteroid isomerase-like protein